MEQDPVLRARAAAEHLLSGELQIIVSGMGRELFRATYVWSSDKLEGRAAAGDGKQAWLSLSKNGQLVVSIPRKMSTYELREHPKMSALVAMEASYDFLQVSQGIITYRVLSNIGNRSKLQFIFPDKTVQVDLVCDNGGLPLTMESDENGISWKWEYKWKKEPTKPSDHAPAGARRTSSPNFNLALMSSGWRDLINSVHPFTLYKDGSH